MKKSTKGALAAAAAGTLLLGGAGSLAYWSTSATVTGTDVATGHLALLTPNCGAWQLDSGENAPLTYADGDPLVPGDALTRVCTYVIDASGNHLRATVSAAAPTLPAPLADAFTVSAVDLQVNNVAATEFTELNDGQTLQVTVKATFNSSVTDHMDLNAVLGDVTVNVNQVHN
ncbi:alternate-type signal peptide domain-containing protein [Nocardioides marmoriginsengisoli]|uniref:Alternate-type signal peptide domain-containing protein n=1 Tax=Nocardioides marmoriginsengisoli TaxID=661483 RepID=A0A3N0CL09_9ACTN|nr:alternate-type signal peptide domain-containing protein [Nocardioides marmoriginsengisoli]RNL64145.1 alternate-type signal peptide domain-containing protein [Nocardioides marmoriginsengisoli]